MFAQLTVGGVWRGPHVFVVRIRDDAGRLAPGVRIKDMDAKMGLNGVDNGERRRGGGDGLIFVVKTGIESSSHPPPLFFSRPNLV